MGGFISLTVKNQHPSEIRPGGRPGSRAFPGGAWWKEDSLLHGGQAPFHSNKPFHEGRGDTCCFCEGGPEVGPLGPLYLRQWSLAGPPSGCFPWPVRAPSSALQSHPHHCARDSAVLRALPGPGPPRTETPGVTFVVVSLLCPGGWAGWGGPGCRHRLSSCFSKPPTLSQHPPPRLSPGPRLVGSPVGSAWPGRRLKLAGPSGEPACPSVSVSHAYLSAFLWPSVAVRGTGKEERCAQVSEAPLTASQASLVRAGVPDRERQWCPPGVAWEQPLTPQCWECWRAGPSARDALPAAGTRYVTRPQGW